MRSQHRPLAGRDHRFGDLLGGFLDDDLMLRVRDAAAEILDDLSAYKDNATARSSE
jgi:hypothetical protein